MESSVEASVVPSSLAERYLEEGSQYIQEDLPRKAKHAFNRAVQEDPALARHVADYYDLAGDALQGPETLKRRREYYGTAKDFYKRLLREPTPPGTDPLVFRADTEVRIGNAYNKMSSLNPEAYNAHDTERAIAYFDHAVKELGGLHMEQAHQGRLLALAKKLGNGQVRPWYRGGQQFEPVVLASALQDLSTLYTLPANALELVERFATTAALFSYPMDAPNQALVLEDIIPQMGSYLWQPAPNLPYGEVQKAVMSAFEKLLREHAWAAPAVAPHLQAFVHNGDIQYDQLEALGRCYRALLDGNKAYAGNCAEDLEVLRQQFSGQSRALGTLTSLAHMFIDLHDSIDSEDAPRSAMQTVLRIGVNATSADLAVMAIEVLVYAADTYPELSEDCVRYLGELAASHDRPSSPCRATVVGRVKMHLLNMRRVPHLQNVVLETLFERLGVPGEDLAELPPPLMGTASYPV